MDDRGVYEEGAEKIEKVPEPKDMVVYDPDHPLYERRHVCVVLRKVMDALHGYGDEESADEQ